MPAMPHAPAETQWHDGLRQREEALRERELWLAGQRGALEFALNDAPLTASLGLLVRTATERFGHGVRAAFYLANPEGSTLHHIVGMPADYAEAVDGFRIGPQSLACGLATHIGQPVLTADVTKEPLWGPWVWLAEKFGFRGCWSFPIQTAAGKFVGTLAVYWPQPREATARDRDLAALLTQVAAIIIARHTDAEVRRQAEDALRQSQAQLESELAASKLLQGISAEMAQEGNAEALHEKIMDAAMAIMRSDFASMQMLYPERGNGGELRLLAFRGFDPRAAKFWEWVRADSGCTCGEALRTGRRALASDVATCEFMAGTADREMYLQSGLLAAQSTPLVSRSGKILGMISTHWRKPHEPTERDFQLFDVLARQAADLVERKQAEDRLRGSERRSRELLDAIPAAVYTTDAAGRITYFNQAAAEFAGRVPELGTDEWCVTWKLYHPDGTRMPHDQCPMAVALKEGLPVRGAEAIAERPDGTRIWFSPYPTPLRDDAGRIVGAINMLVDITERKRAEETQRLLLNELNHRVKNTLAVVQAVAQRTLARTRDPAQFAESFGGRIQSLARVHSLLSGTNWQGAELRELIRDQLLSGPVDEVRLTAWGPAVRLDAQTALHVALILHELGTNSCKYGALSAAAGWVTVNWTTSDALHIRWVERGGPPVTAPSTRGFGMTLIEHSARSQGGDACMLCEAEGVTWDITLPLHDQNAFSTAPQIVRPAMPVVEPDAAGKTPSSIAGRRFLVVEDEPLIGLDIIAALEDAQAAVEGPVGTAEQATEIIERISLDGALLDANLHGRPVDEIASALARCNIPFVFVTGHGRDSLPGGFREARILAKPFSRRQVLDAVEQLATATPNVVRLRR